MTSRRVEQDIRDRLIREARGFPQMIRDRKTEAELAIGMLVRTAFGSAERLAAAVEQLERDDPDATEALALLRRAVRRAADPPEPEKPRPSSPPAAPEAGAG